jgi:23S rRNA pseudouridine1911/1915/1917 synthase
MTGKKIKKRTETSEPSAPIELAAAPADAGMRLDRFLSSRLEGLTRSRIQALIRSGRVSGPAGTIGDTSARVKPGERFEVSVPPPEAARPEAETIPLNVTYEDDDLIVIDKPAGLVVHPSAGHASGTLVNALIAHCGASLSGIGGVKRPGIVHRLDKETSGLLVVAKSDAAHQGLQGQFAAHGADGRLERTYLAIVWGAPARPRGTIDARLARSPANRTRIAVVRGERGRHAVTHYQVIDTFVDGRGKPLASLLQVRLETGRTHQIRVHLAHIGHPVMGDPTYGAGFKTSASRLAPEAQAALAALGRQALHAAELGFEHPLTGRRLRFSSPLPDDIDRLRKALGWSGTPAVPSARTTRNAKRT